MSIKNCLQQYKLMGHKYQADESRSERSFQVGDHVYLQLEPYVHNSLMRRPSHKLSFHYFGPFPVVEKIGSVAYRLQLPPISAIHLVFRVSLSKLTVGIAHRVSRHVLAVLDYPFQILDRIL